MSNLFAQHKAVLDGAISALQTRCFWSAYPETPSGKIYGEDAKAVGQSAFSARLHKPFVLAGHPADDGQVGAEQSPFGLGLEITYPAAKVETLLAAAHKAASGWAAAPVELRVGICLEILHRLNKRSFELANAVMHTTGQAFAMAFQAGGPHAQDRGLEAVAYSYLEMLRTPQTASWVKPQGRAEPISMQKRFRILPRGIALMIGCQTFPTWNGYPGLFASLATGNAVIVKPHPGAILPLAITLEVARDVLEQEGFDPNVLLLAADERGSEKTKELALHPAIGIIDFTGSNAFGRWLRDNARQAVVYTEEAGVNSIVIDSTDDFSGMCANIAFSLSLYSGQMCTAPQDIFISRSGIETNEGHKSIDEVAAGIAGAVDALLADPARASGVCGALANADTLKRVQAAAKLGQVVRNSASIEGQEGARTATPMILKVDAGDSAYLDENFGPITFIVACADTVDAIARAAKLATEKGAITAAVYSTQEAVLDRAEDAFGNAGVNLSCNLVGNIFVNQSAAFSDYHVTGANPAGNASLTDGAFVANRFRVVMSRRLTAA